MHEGLVSIQSNLPLLPSILLDRIFDMVQCWACRDSSVAVRRQYLKEHIRWKPDCQFMKKVS